MLAKIRSSVNTMRFLIIGSAVSLTVLLGIIFTWRIIRQGRLIEFVESVGGSVYYKDSVHLNGGPSVTFGDLPPRAFFGKPVLLPGDELFIDLSGSQIQPEDIDRLADNSQFIVRLSMESLPITDEDILPLLQLHRLKYLDLSGTKITGKSLKRIAEDLDVAELGLANTAVADSDLNYILREEQLRWLDLSQTETSENAAEVLREALPKCKIQK